MEQRRMMASREQVDESEDLRLYCGAFDFDVDTGELKREIAELEAAPALSAGDVLGKQEKLKALRAELVGRESYMKAPLKRLAAPSETPDDAEAVWLSFPQAMCILADSHGASPEELAGWVWDGNLRAYEDETALMCPFQPDYASGEVSFDYLARLMAFEFKRHEVEAFEPKCRYITGAALLERWRNQAYIQAEPFICAQVASGRLSEIHPIMGVTQASFPGELHRPPLTEALFELEAVERVEVENLFDVVMSTPGTKRPLVCDSGNTLMAESTGTALDHCSAFRALQGLRPDEIAMAFIGDRSDAGLCGNNMLEISARGVCRRVSLAEFGFVDRRNGTLTQQAVVLIGLAQGKEIRRTGDANAKIMERLRAILRKHLGLKHDPFLPHNSERGWLPLFSISDRRGAADERAKRDAERKTVSLELMQEAGHQFAADENNWAEEDPADQWLKEHAPKRRS